AFATALEKEGIRRWLQLKRNDEARAVYYRYQQREDDFYRLISDTRRELLDCYDGRNDYSLPQRKSCKESVFSAMKSSYSSIREKWGNGVHYDRWF
ncbi:MAG: hypothetical protein GWN13_15600, partial [Phycisphaerae bacterium]|nr:hypothetical protein [Phycisphaerae bacterium]